jgi:hypothetical protein
MKEFIIKLFLGMVINSISVKEVVAAIEKLKKDLQDKVAATPGKWDDMAVAAFLSSEDQVLDLFVMLKDMVDEKVKESESTLDDVIWMPVSEKINEIITELKKS